MVEFIISPFGVIWSDQDIWSFYSQWIHLSTVMVGKNNHFPDPQESPALRGIHWETIGSVQCPYIRHTDATVFTSILATRPIQVHQLCKSHLQHMKKQSATPQTHWRAQNLLRLSQDHLPRHCTWPFLFCHYIPDWPHKEV